MGRLTSHVWIVPFVAISFVTGASPARAVTINVTGADGVDGSPTKPPPQELFGLSGQTGGDAEPADAQAISADPDNRAVATGGRGGAGGPGGDSLSSDPFVGGGSGGDGGKGGTASASSATDIASGDASATSLAQGGSGGPGGMTGSPLRMFPPAAPQGSAGVDGDSNAAASARSLAGSATSDAEATHGQSTTSSSAQATSGLASATALSAATGQGNASSAHASGITAGGDAQVVSRATGAGHADSVSTAESHEGSATASAEASGSGTILSDVNADANAAAQDDDATATAKATGVGFESAGAASSAQAHASAVTHGAGNALASATALGAPANPSPVPGTAQARAEAFSDQGNATARVLEAAGGGLSPQVSNPGRIDEGPFGGGPGGDEELVDAVHGSAAGRLTLSQEADGGNGGNAGGGAHSVLHAENSAGGEIAGEAIARGGSPAFFDYPNQWFVNGGAADAEVTATDTLGSRAEADALAAGGVGEHLWSPFYAGATAHATAQGLGVVTARAEADGGTGSTDALASAQSTGPIRAAHGEITSTLPSGAIGFTNHEVNVAVASLRDAAPLPVTQLTSPSQSEVSTFAAPLLSDVTAWTAGSPHAQQALQGRTVLGLGSVVAEAGGSNGGVSGSVSLDLDASSFANGSGLQLVFLHPDSTVDFLDVLHVRFSIDGRQVFEESTTGTAAARAALEDTVVDLGSVGVATGDLRKLELDFDLSVLPDLLGAFSFNFAVATPEPDEGLLAWIAAVGVAWAARQRARVRQSHSRA